MNLIVEKFREVVARIQATEPVRVAERIRVLLFTLVGAGWLTLDETTVNAVATVAALALSWLLSRFARKNVTPVAKLGGDHH